jgi:hypothetical protein
MAEDKNTNVAPEGWRCKQPIPGLLVDANLSEEEKRAAVGRYLERERMEGQGIALGDAEGALLSLLDLSTNLHQVDDLEPHTFVRCFALIARSIEREIVQVAKRMDLTREDRAHLALALKHVQLITGFVEGCREDDGIPQFVGDRARSSGQIIANLTCQVGQHLVAVGGVADYWGDEDEIAEEVSHG